MVADAASRPSAPEPPDVPGSAPEPPGAPGGRALPARVWLPAGLALVALVGVLGWLVAQPSGSSSTRLAGVSPGADLRHLASGGPAPGFRLPNLRGGAPVTLAADRGTPVVVNFFASWCHPCQAEIGAFVSEARATAGRVDFIGVDTNDTSRSAAIRFVKGAGVGYPVGLDDSGPVTAAYDVAGLPATVFVDREGRVVGETFGQLSRATLARWVARLEA